MVVSKRNYKRNYKCFCYKTSDSLNLYLSTTTTGEFATRHTQQRKKNELSSCIHYVAHITNAIQFFYCSIHGCSEVLAAGNTLFLTVNRLVCSKWTCTTLVGPGIVV